MKRSDIVRSIQVKFKRLSVADSVAMINNISNHLADALANGDRVEIRGFGTFQTRIHAPKITTNPRTGKKIHLPSRKTILFRPSPRLIKKMNEA
ncbi:MAG: HU family DNA-binding protein [Alphaproteobacteria bacterium]|jgi:integration host factor subunit beta|nr:integration host factor subunit beta [Alphaproteobacteria bacterium]